MVISFRYAELYVEATVSNAVTIITRRVVSYREQGLPSSTFKVYRQGVVTCRSVRDVRVIRNVLTMVLMGVLYLDGRATLIRNSAAVVRHCHGVE